jgi:hypothetical protein
MKDLNTPPEAFEAWWESCDKGPDLDKGLALAGYQEGMAEVYRQVRPQLDAQAEEIARLRKAALKFVGEWDRDEEAYDVFAVEQAIRQLRAALRAEGRGAE